MQITPNPLRSRLQRAVEREFDGSANIDLAHYSAVVALKILDRELAREEKGLRKQCSEDYYLGTQAAMEGVIISRQILLELKKVLAE